MTILYANTVPEYFCQYFYNKLPTEAKKSYLKSIIYDFTYGTGSNCQLDLSKEENLPVIKRKCDGKLEIINYLGFDNGDVIKDLPSSLLIKIRKKEICYFKNNIFWLFRLIKSLLLNDLKINEINKKILTVRRIVESK